jgi:hypothetical protein
MSKYKDKYFLRLKLRGWPIKRARFFIDWEASGEDFQDFTQFCQSGQNILSKKANKLHFTSFGRVREFEVDAEILFSLNETSEYWDYTI